MRVNISIIFQLYFFCSVFAQSPNWNWAHTVGGKFDDYVTDIKTTQNTANGFTYVLGFFDDTLFFTNGVVLLPTYPGSQNFFVAYFDSDAKCMWAIESKSMQNAYGASMHMLPNGNVLITGNFSDTLFLGNDTLISSGGDDIFFAELSSTGNFKYSYSFGGVNEDRGIGIGVDTSGKYFYVSGLFYSSTVLDTFNFSGIGYNAFVFKADTSGKIIWAKTARGTSGIGLSKSCVDRFGNSYLNGHFTDTIYIDSVKLTTYGIYEDVYTAAYDSDGNLKWAKKFGGYFIDRARGVTYDVAGSVYITGNFSDSAYFGNKIIKSRGLNDAFIAKYNSSGKEQWVLRIGGPTDDRGMDLVSDRNSNVFICGIFRDWIIFNDTSEDPKPPTPAEYLDSFVAKYDSSGRFIWGKTIPGPKGVDARELSIDINGNSYVTGMFKTKATFDSIILYDNFGMLDIFVSKLNNKITSGVGEYIYDENSNILIYPNPSKNYFTIEVINEGKIDKIEIFNIEGKLIYSNINIGNVSSAKVNLKLHPAGMYFVKVYSIDKVFFSKLMFLSDN